jgi:hypothetical protein
MHKASRYVSQFFQPAAPSTNSKCLALTIDVFWLSSVYMHSGTESAAGKTGQDIT